MGKTKHQGRRRMYAFIVILGLFCILLPSCAAQVLPPASASASASGASQEITSPEGNAAPEDYHLGSEDVVEVLVWKNPDISRVVTIRPDGKISLPLIGDVQAAELTAMQLAEQINEKLKPYYKDPAPVTVIVQQVNSYAIYILGEVRRPGKYVVKSGITFIQAITLAGGFTEYASTSKITLLRRENDVEVPMRIRYKDILRGRQSNLILEPNDSLIVP